MTLRRFVELAQLGVVRDAVLVGVVGQVHVAILGFHRLAARQGHVHDALVRLKPLDLASLEGRVLARPDPHLRAGLHRPRESESKRETGGVCHDACVTNRPSPGCTSYCVTVKGCEIRAGRQELSINNNSTTTERVEVTYVGLSRRFLLTSAGCPQPLSVGSRTSGDTDLLLCSTSRSLAASRVSPSLISFFPRADCASAKQSKKARQLTQLSRQL